MAAQRAFGDYDIGVYVRRSSRIAVGLLPDHSICRNDAQLTVRSKAGLSNTNSDRRKTFLLGTFVGRQAVIRRRTILIGGGWRQLWLRRSRA